MSTESLALRLQRSWGFVRTVNELMLRSEEATRLLSTLNVQRPTLQIAPLPLRHWALGVGRCWPVTGTRNRHNPYSTRTTKCLKFIGSEVERVIRAFVKIREQLATNAAILKRLAEIDKTLLVHDSALRDVYQKLLPLLSPPPDPPHRRIGFH